MNYKSRKLPEIDPNRPVYVFDPRMQRIRSSKFQCPWTGPFQITQQVNSKLWKICFPGRRGIKIIHRSNMYQPKLK